MHSIYNSIAHMSGFTPPLSKRGKELATYGDAVLRERVLRRLVQANFNDLTLRVSHICGRDNQAKVVTEIELANVCALPIGHYVSGSNLEAHTLSTILESVVGECALNGGEQFIDAIVTLLCEEASVPTIGGTAELKEGLVATTEEKPSVQSVHVTKAVVGPHEAISLVHEWAAKAGHDKPVVIWTTEGDNHCCKVTVANFETTASETSKRKARQIAFNAIWDRIDASESNVIVPDTDLSARAEVEPGCVSDTQSAERPDSVGDSLKAAEIDLADQVRDITQENHEEETPYKDWVKEVVKDIPDFVCHHLNLDTEDEAGRNGMNGASAGVKELSSPPPVDMAFLHTILG